MSEESIVLIALFVMMAVCVIAFFIFMAYIEKLERKYPRSTKQTLGYYEGCKSTRNHDKVMWKYRSKPVRNEAEDED